MSTPVTFTLTPFSEGYCWKGPQQYAIDLIANLAGAVSVGDLVISATTPAVDDQDKLWARLDANGYLEGLYTFLGGYWCRPHPTPPGSSERRIWVGANDSSLWGYDGGSGADPGSSVPTATTGAMWEVDTTFEFKFPLGVGTNGTSYDGGSATSVAVGDTGGAERVLLDDGETPIHAHVHTDGTPVGNTQIGDAQNAWYAMEADGTTKYFNERNLGAAGKRKTSDAELDPNDPAILSHNNMPPYKAVYYIKRTARKFYTV